MKRSLFLSLCVTLSAASAPPAAAAASPERNPVDEDAFRVSVVRDGDSPLFAAFLESLRSDLEALSIGNRRVVLNPIAATDPDWNRDRVEKDLRKALADPKADAVLALGRWGVGFAADPENPLAKPVVGVAVLARKDAASLYDAKRDATGKKNLNLVLMAVDAEADARKLRNLAGCDRIAVVLDSPYPDPDPLLESLRSVEGLEVVPLRIRTPEDLRKKIGSLAADAVYLALPYRMDGDAWKQVVETCNRAGLPTFGLRGAADVRLGALAGMIPEYEHLLSHRAAIHLERIAEGEDPASLAVEVDLERDLILNAETARAIGFAPATEALTKAGFESVADFESGEPLGLEEAFSLALRNNPLLRIADTRVRQAEGNRGRARGDLLPRIDLRADYTRVREAVAAESDGLQPESQTTVGGRIAQILYDDERISAFRIANRTLEGRRYAYEEARLNLLERTALAYLALLRADAVRSIALENLDVSRQNLRVARRRRQSGELGPGDVARWKAAVASGKADVLDTETRREQALDELNQVLGAGTGSRWVPSKPGEASGRARVEAFLANGFANVDEARSFESYVIRNALRRSPALRELRKGVEAGAIALRRTERSFFLPEVEAGFRFSRAVHQDFAGPLPDESPERNDWTALVTARLPVFEGGGRVGELVEAKAALSGAELLLADARDRIGKVARDTCVELANSYRIVDFREEAAEAAAENLKLARACYARGECGILRLLDAQEKSFSARLQAAIARFEYEGNLFRFQRVNARFLFEHTPAENREWWRKFELLTQNNSSPFPPNR
jgi:outer membrane protein TolC